MSEHKKGYNFATAAELQEQQKTGRSVQVQRDDRAKLLDGQRSTFLLVFAVSPELLDRKLNLRLTCDDEDLIKNGKFIHVGMELMKADLELSGEDAGKRVWGPSLIPLMNRLRQDADVFFPPAKDQQET